MLLPEINKLTYWGIVLGCGLSLGFSVERLVVAFSGWLYKAEDKARFLHGDSPELVRIQLRLSMKRYLGSKYVYEYERISLNIPRKFHKTVKPFLKQDLDCGFSHKRQLSSHHLDPSKNYKKYHGNNRDVSLSGWDEIGWTSLSRHKRLLQTTGQLKWQPHPRGNRSLLKNSWHCWKRKNRDCKLRLRKVWNRADPRPFEEERCQRLRENLNYSKCC